MRTAFSKHALLAGLLTAMLSALASLAAPVMVAFANTPSAEVSAPPASPDAPASGTPASSAPAASGSSTSGGAAPTPDAPDKPTLATWFGPGFYGHETACGQRMSPKLVGVASRTLPCGTLVQIGYRGHQLTVPVLDRGPYGHNGAVWDLTTGAARALAIKDTVRITAQIVGSVQNTPALGEPATAGAPSAALAAPPAATTGGATAAG
jgi:rare lipoprotein A (peptidoglycan hydrolase)